MSVIYLPVYLYYLFLSVRSGSFFYFTASNPGIENAGMLGESKFPILQKISRKPLTAWFDSTADLEYCMNRLSEEGITFPAIAKPDIGERGWGVRKLEDKSALATYLDWVPVPFILQEYVDLPLEAGVFYHRFPDQRQGKITSLVLKDFLSVTGDGVDSLRELIQKSDRALLQLDRLEEQWGDRMEEVVPKGQVVELVGIGNHSLGTRFINGAGHITEKMERSFDEIALEFEGFYFGRFDLRCESIEALEAGQVKILELNGAGSEPAHIYEPGYPLLRGIGDLLAHQRILYRISKANHDRGVQYMSFRRGREEFIKVRRYNRKYKT